MGHWSLNRWPVPQVAPTALGDGPAAVGSHANIICVLRVHAARLAGGHGVPVSRPDEWQRAARPVPVMRAQGHLHNDGCPSTMTATAAPVMHVSQQCNNDEIFADCHNVARMRGSPSRQ